MNKREIINAIFACTKNFDSEFIVNIVRRNSHGCKSNQSVKYSVDNAKILIEEEKCVKCEAHQISIAALNLRIEKKNRTLRALVATLEEEKNTVDLRGIFNVKGTVTGRGTLSSRECRKAMTGRELIATILKDAKNLDSEFTVKNIQRNRQGDVVNIYNIEGYTVVDGEIIIETRRQ